MGVALRSIPKRNDSSETVSNILRTVEYFALSVRLTRRIVLVFQRNFTNHFSQFLYGKQLLYSWIISLSFETGRSRHKNRGRSPVETYGIIFSKNRRTISIFTRNFTPLVGAVVFRHTIFRLPYNLNASTTRKAIVYALG